MTQETETEAELCSIAADLLIEEHKSVTPQLATILNDLNDESFSKSHSSITMTSNRRKSMIYRSPTVTSQKDIRTVCFYLAIHGIVIGFVGWCCNILITLFYANQCPLFHPNGNISLFTFLYCTLINTQIIETCNYNNYNYNNHIISFFIIGFITALLPNLFGTLFGFLWKSKVPDLSVLSSRQRSIGNSIMSHKNDIIRKLISWSLIILICFGCLIGEYFIDNTYFCRNIKGGRYTYCLVVIFMGLFIIQCIQYITNWEFKSYSIDGSDDMLQIITSQKRTALFHRDLTVFMINTTIGVLLPAMNKINGGDIDIYISILIKCIGEATGFIWSACITSQTMALIIELAMKWIYNKIEKQYIPFIPKDKRGWKYKCIIFIFNKIGKKHVHGLYVTHENWFILIVLFLWQCQWGWLNPNMFVMGAGTMLYITIIYKIRFIYLKPRIEKQFIAHLVREECFLYMIYLFIPIQFIILLPLKCNIITFGLPVISLFITFLNAIIYKLCLRKNRTPYLVAITKQWNHIENKLNDTRGIKSIDVKY